MGSIAQDESVTTSNPRIFFAFQQDGKLFDLFSLSRSVFSVAVDGSTVLVVADAAQDISTTGVRVAQGVYHANFTATGFVPGTYEIRWTYQLLNTDTPKQVRQRFEVLDKTQFYQGSSYTGYASTSDLMQYATFSNRSVGQIQTLIDSASRKIEDLTGRFFEPRYKIVRINGRGIRGLALQEPIIGVNKLEIESSANGINLDLTPISLDGVRMYARHLQGLTDPDDRDDPRIEIERFEGMIFQSLSVFPKGPQTIHVTGVFGYTDPDGGPMGMTPRDLTRVIGYYASKQILDPFGLDKTIQNPGGVAGAKTRDQSVSYFMPNTNILGHLTITGDPFIDEILVKYLRPMHLAAV